MDNRIQDAFAGVRAPDRLKRATKAALRKRTFDYGRNRLRLQTFRRRAASAAVMLALVLAGAGLWFLPAASIAVDINPSLELKVNALDRVISLEGKNADGIALVEELRLNGMSYEDAMQRLLLSHGLEPYLERNSAITITVAGGGTDAHAEQILNRVLCRAYNIAGQENVLCYQVDWETVRAARSAGLCIPRYLAWQELKKTDPAVTAEDVRALPKEVVHEIARVERPENPCGE